jgi:hypothetical protein
MSEDKTCVVTPPRLDLPGPPPSSQLQAMHNLHEPWHKPSRREEPKFRFDLYTEQRRGPIAKDRTGAGGNVRKNASLTLRVC